MFSSGEKGLGISMRLFLEIGAPLQGCLFEGVWG